MFLETENGAGIEIGRAYNIYEVPTRAEKRKRKKLMWWASPPLVTPRITVAR